MKLDERVLNKLLDLFFEVVGKRYDKGDFQKIIEDLLTPAERIMIAKRIAVYYLLLKNIDYRTISNVLKISQTTISKLNVFKEKSEGIIPTFNRIVRNEKIGEFLEEVSLALMGPGTYGTNWKAGWKHKKELARRKTEGI